MRMGGFSRLTRRRVPPVTHTDALFAGQSHSIPDNLVALLGTSRAWNCSDPERVFGNTSGFGEREIYWNDVRYLRSFRNRFPQGVLPRVTHCGPTVRRLAGRRDLLTAVAAFPSRTRRHA